MSTVAVTPSRFFERPSLFAAGLKPLHAVLNAPALIFLVTLTAMLFRPPDLKCCPADRIALVLLLCVFAFRLNLRREHLRFYKASWPLLGLMLLGFWGTIAQPFEPQAWSVLIAKWIVPFVFFHIAGSIFQTEASLRKLELFLVGALIYLTAVSVLFLFGQNWLIFPRFILDEGIGIHADRARGPFLQAVANGVSLNILGLVALNVLRTGIFRRTRALLLFVAVPLALLATKTRAVWLSAALSVAYLAFFGPTVVVRRTAKGLCAIALVGACVVFLYDSGSGDISERMMDRSPVDFRLEMYQAGWQMFTERPVSGWGTEAMIQAEMEKRLSSFHPERYLFHNTYLELGVEHGLLGLGLYAWLMVCLFRLGKSDDRFDRQFWDSKLRALWPLIVVVYLVNASAVVMNYQFVNGLLFTLAGILAAQGARENGLGKDQSWRFQ